MSRQGREFELLIKKIEEILLPETAEISSPGFIKDRITDELREVDILIEYTIGTFPVKIVIECRNRNSVQDTTWVEQIHTKLNDININKAILVSSSPFTQPAIEKAKFYNIETRTYEEIDAKLIRSWWLVDSITVITRQHKIISSKILVDNPNFNKDFLKDKNVTTKFINRPSDNKIFSLNDIILANTDKLDDWNNLLPSSPSIVKKIILDYNQPESRFIINIGNENTYITKILFEVELNLILSTIPVSRVNQYSDKNKVISQVIEFDNFPLVNNDILQFIKNSDGSISLSLRKNEKNIS